MNGYVGDSRELVLCMLMVKLIKMDTNLSREFIGDAYIATNMEMGELINQVLALNLFMKLLFTYIWRDTLQRSTTMTRLSPWWTAS